MAIVVNGRINVAIASKSRNEDEQQEKLSFRAKSNAESRSL